MKFARKHIAMSVGALLGVIAIQRAYSVLYASPRDALNTKISRQQEELNRYVGDAAARDELAGRRSEFIATTYRGFIKALVTHNAALVGVISARLRMEMLKSAEQCEKIAGLTRFVVDGSKCAAPWTKANEQKLGKKGRKPRGKKCRRQETAMRPQLTLSLLWHMGRGLPWAWKHGGLSDGERDAVP